MSEYNEGDVVFMKASSGLCGYGNAQCISSVCEPLGEISLYGHNQIYNMYDIARVVVEHTDPTEIKTALALAVKQLARAEKALAVIASCNSCFGCQSEAKKAINDKQLEDVLMPDKGGE